MKMKSVVSWMLSLMLVLTMIPMFSAAVCAEDGDGSPAISIGAGNIEKGNKVYMGVRLLGTGPFTESPISWLVLGEANSTDLKSDDVPVETKNARLLITEKTQGEVQFDPDGQSNVWQGSNIQRWCGEFITEKDGGWIPETESFEWQDHFNRLEKETMLYTSKEDGQYNEWGTSSLDNERLFLLSAEEVSDDYGYFNGDDSRIAYQHDRDETWDWWLRSPNSRNSFNAARVKPDGGVEDNDVRDWFGARPAFNINLNSVLFTSAAAGGKSSGAAGADALTAVSANITNEWKMTLHDSGRDGFAAAAATGAVLSQNEGYTSWCIPVVYSGASTANDHDYVSVILADSSDKALYYGNIAKQTAASSDAGQEVNIPAGLAAGDYKLYVFSEQVNGDKLTDYAGAFKKINLTVNALPAETCTVTFDAAGGTWTDGTTVNKEVTVEKGNAANPPADPTREGFTFDGWDKDFSNVTSNLTVTAKWKENTQPPEPTKITVPTGKTLTYNGKAQTGVAAGTGYTLSGTTTATNAGSYKATATLKEGYAWSDGSTAAKTISWKINPKAITPAVTLSAKVYTYNGKVRKPTVTVKNGSTKLAASQYDVTYASGRKNVGTYKVTVKMKGNYSGSKAVSFKINPKGTSLSKVTKAKKAATVKWKKQAAKMSTSRITGYQIQLATNSKFTKNKKTVNVKGYSKTSKKVTGLKGGKKYWVRIRTYKKVGSTTYYSPWSKVKTVTTGK